MKISFLLGLLCLCTSIYSQQIVTDRPNQTEASSTVPTGSLQIESGFLLSYPAMDGDMKRKMLAPTTLFRLGITRWIELRVLSQVENQKNPYEPSGISGISDLEIGAKVQLFKKENSRSEIAFMTHLILPTGTPLFSNDRYGSVNRLLISHRISDELSIGYNLGYNNFGYIKGDFVYTFAIAYAIGEKAGVFLEPYGEVKNFTYNQANINAGFTYLLSNFFQADFSFGTGIINTRANFVSCGVSYLILKK